jgi:hypothetical protein
MRFLLAIALVAAASSAHAAPKLSVLEVIPSLKTKGYHAILDPVRATLTAELRTLVQRDGKTYAFHPIAKSADQKAMAQACTGRPPGCWATLIRELKSNSLLYGTVEVANDDIFMVVTLQHGTKMPRTVSRKVDLMDLALSDRDQTIRLLAQEMYLELHGRPVPQTR